MLLSSGPVNERDCQSTKTYIRGFGVAVPHVGLYPESPKHPGETRIARKTRLKTFNCEFLTVPSALVLSQTELTNIQEEKNNNIVDDYINKSIKT